MDSVTGSLGCQMGAQCGTLEPKKEPRQRSAGAHQFEEDTTMRTWAMPPTTYISAGSAGSLGLKKGVIPPIWVVSSPMTHPDQLGVSSTTPPANAPRVPAASRGRPSDPSLIALAAAVSGGGALS